jgi:hypothetical protein
MASFTIDGPESLSLSMAAVFLRPPLLTGYAYETIPGKSIIAGQTKGPEDGAQPTPASMKTHAPKPISLRGFEPPLKRAVIHCKTANRVGVEALFMLRCDRSPVMLTCLQKLRLQKLRNFSA